MQNVKKGGMKKFIAYSIKHAENNGNIERRYKQFDWLDQRLTEQFPCSLRPQLPEKQASGRFEHEFIERRKVSLSRSRDVRIGPVQTFLSRTRFS